MSTKRRSHPVFRVLNLDERGRRLSPGHLEITPENIILHQKHRTPVQWPLKTLRR